jgi:hypothetical protein
MFCVKQNVVMFCAADVEGDVLWCTGDVGADVRG